MFLLGLPPMGALVCIATMECTPLLSQIVYRCVVVRQCVWVRQIQMWDAATVAGNGSLSQRTLGDQARRKPVKDPTP